MNEDVKNLLNNPDLLVKKYFKDQKFCMARFKNDCKGNICQAHTISKKFLKNISEKGHLYLPVGSNHHKHSFYEFELKGINNATTITGFCQYHDNFLFESFEKKEFIAEYKQIYDLTFRSLCREFFQKKCLLKFLTDISEGITLGVDKNGFLKSDLFKKQLTHCQKEVRDHRFLYDQLHGLQYNGLKFLLIEISNFPISTTGVLFPLFDPNGNKIQNECHNQHGFIYNLIPLNGKTYIIIATVASLHNNVHKNFLQSIYNLNEKLIINYLITYLFFNNDNLVINPSWYDSLDISKKELLLRLMNIQVGNYSSTNFVESVDFFDMIQSPKLKARLYL